MADDLDWNAIIAPGNDAARRGTGPSRPSDGSSSTDDHDGTSGPIDRRPSTRREARAERATSAPVDGDPADAARPVAPADAPVAGSADELHPEVHALLTDDGSGETASSTIRTGSTDDLPGHGADASSGRGDGGGDGRGRGGRASRPPREPRPKRSKGAVIAGVVIVAVVVGAGIGAFQFVAPKIASVANSIGGGGDQETDDYTGDGTSKVTVTIKQGDIGTDISKTLERSGVVKTSTAFYQLLLASPDVAFQPGSYALKKQMSSKAALAALQDADNKVTASIVIPEGTALVDIEAGMVSKAGLSKASVDAAAADVGAYGLPSGVDTLEGWLFPATYPINPGWDAKQYFQQMVDTMKEHLASAGVAEADQERVIVFASLVQKEAGLAADYPKVARVFQNRLDQGMRLQSDATVAYGTGNTHTVTTTDAERADASNPYNTYVHDGLPPKPISNPGDIAIKAVTGEATGNWLYFVTVNLETGETVFSDTYDQHLAAVRQFQSWLRDHPSYQ